MIHTHLHSWLHKGEGGGFTREVSALVTQFVIHSLPADSYWGLEWMMMHRWMMDA